MSDDKDRQGSEGDSSCDNRTPPKSAGGRGATSDRNAVLIEALLDGELGPDEEEEVRRLMSSCDSLRSEYQSQKLLREELQAWFEQSLERSGGAVNVWSKIESRLLEESARQLRWRLWWDNALDYFRSPGPSRGAFAAVCATLLAVVVSSARIAPTGTVSLPNSGIPNPALQQYSGSQQHPESQQFASGTGATAVGQVRALPGENLPTTPVSLGQLNGERSARNIQRVGAPIFYSRSGDDSPRGFAFHFSLSSRKGTTKNVGSRLPSGQQLVALRRVPQNEKNFLRSGMRTSGAEIDWIRSDRTFRIVRPTQEKLPPVIWVAGPQRLD